MSRLLILALFLLLCLRGTAEDNDLRARRVQVLEPVVTIVAHSSLTPDRRASGVVVKCVPIPEGHVSYILTACHTFQAPFCTGATPDGVPIMESRIIDKVSVLSWNFDTWKSTEFKGLVIAYSVDLDVAVIKVAQKLPVARVIARRPVVFEDVYGVGSSVAVIPLPNPGKVTGVSDSLMTISSTTYPGYSGGGVFLNDDGKWGLSAIITRMGSLGKKSTVVHGVGIATPVSTILKWGSENKVEGLIE